MKSKDNSYDFIKNKIETYKEIYPSLRKKPDSYVFSALAAKSNYFKNPSLDFREEDFEEIIVDSKNDGGVDILFSDPSSETCDMVIAQSKFYTEITLEDIYNALMKMGIFYRDMQQGHYENVNSKVKSRFLSLDSEIGEESKINFVIYTSAPKSGIRKDRIEKRFRESFTSDIPFEINILFGPDIEEEIKESESRRPTVESGKIQIDKANNYLLYGDNAAIVNVSALSIKRLYSEHNTNLLSRNLRYHVAGREIDNAIKDTIKNEPEQFWVRNNGITIICDNFDIDGKVVRLSNFSIVNGGQTTYMISRSELISENNDLYLPCKLIKVLGDTEDEKNMFSLEIAKATNSQKAIKKVDLKANAPEQVRFGQAMRECGIFYQTKRGEDIPKQFKEKYLNTDLAAVGKLCLAGIFQMPCSSRSKPSTLYQDDYYDVIFNKNQKQIAGLCKELMYIDYYFRNTFLKKFDKENDYPGSNDVIEFAHNARTICIAFTAFAARYYHRNITDECLQVVINASKRDSATDETYKTFTNLDGLSFLISPNININIDSYESVLDELFDLIIEKGNHNLRMAQRYDQGLNATNYLKKDRNYYIILSDNWSELKNGINRIFENANVKR